MAEEQTRQIEGVLAQLRHAYQQLVGGHVVNFHTFADGLIAPQIRKLEKLLAESPGTVSAPSELLQTRDYRLAPSGEGPLASEWQDKPHRLIYDLCSEIERLRVALDSAWASYNHEVESLRAAHGSGAPPEPQFQEVLDALADAELPVCPTHVDAVFVCPECFKEEARVHGSGAPGDPLAELEHARQEARQQRDEAQARADAAADDSSEWHAALAARDYCLGKFDALGQAFAIVNDARRSALAICPRLSRVPRGEGAHIDGSHEGRRDRALRRVRADEEATRS